MVVGLFTVDKEGVITVSLLSTIDDKIYIFSTAVRPAVLGFVPSSAAKREYSGWLKDRVLKPARKLSIVVTFVSSEIARPDQISNLIKELYIYIFLLGIQYINDKILQKITSRGSETKYRNKLGELAIFANR